MTEAWCLSFQCFENSGVASDVSLFAITSAVLGLFVHRRPSLEQSLGLDMIEFFFFFFFFFFSNFFPRSLNSACMPQPQPAEACAKS